MNDDTESKREIQNQAVMTTYGPLTQSTKCEKGSAVVHDVFNLYSIPPPKYLGLHATDPYLDS